MSQNNNTSVEALVNLLEAVRKRPGLYIGPRDDGAIWYLNTFLSGVNATSELFGVSWDRFDRDIRGDVLVERGWQLDSHGPNGIWQVMFDQGMNMEAIIDELLVIEITVLQRSFRSGTS
ncbi:MAG: hypothetical protein AAGF95_29710 [Chloroflexota bacterium]